MIKLNGKTVLITGASRGIGEAAAQTFIEAGANVMLTARDLSKLKTLKKNGVIIVHDCLPKKIWNQIVPRMYGHWNGDVWKAIVHSRTTQSIDTYTCLADHGLGFIFNRPNRNTTILGKVLWYGCRFLCSDCCCIYCSC